MAKLTCCSYSFPTKNLRYPVGYPSPLLYSATQFFSKLAPLVGPASCFLVFPYGFEIVDSLIRASNSKNKKEKHMERKFDLASHQQFADSITPATIKRTPCDQLWQIMRDLTSALSDVSQAIGAASMGASVNGAIRGAHLLRNRIEDALHDVGNTIRSRCCSEHVDTAAEPHPPTAAGSKRGPRF